MPEQLDVRKFAEAAAPVIAAAIEKALAPVLERLATLETIEIPKGERGEPGERGEKGDPGSDGVGLASAMINRDDHLVVTLTSGAQQDLGIVVGRDGKDGEKGEPGERGEAGADGGKGVDGASGRDGEHGLSAYEIAITQGFIGSEFEWLQTLQGDAGEKGEKGDKGDPGERGDRGEKGDKGEDAYHGQARGLYDPDAEYRALDVVSFNGSEWRAKCDQPGALPGDGWMLSAKCGARGKQGEPGERGAEGRPGKDGARPVEIKCEVSDNAITLVTALDDGHILEADLTPIVAAIRGE